ncbi:MAG: type II toxin-antitoxin system HicA family toxin [Bacteroidales bacterium]|nr:type II toxin-antitoxin system HicA family toxin [Bacteroidales bacterium]
MKVSELLRLLKKAGCTIYRNGGNHDIWFSPITGKKFPVSRHKTEELKPKTLASIKEKAGI